MGVFVSLYIFKKYCKWRLQSDRVLLNNVNYIEKNLWGICNLRSEQTEGKVLWDPSIHFSELNRQVSYSLCAIINN